MVGSGVCWRPELFHRFYCEKGIVMGVSRNEFNVLNTLRNNSGAISSQRRLAAVCRISVGAVNALLKKLSSNGFVDGFVLTDAGLDALQPYRVQNAIIMAAGLSSRFAPLSYERPKGVLTVRGEVLIERQIRQLHKAGISDITVVVGYMKEAFFYLEDKLGVKIRVNEQYSQRNNNSTLMLVREQLGNTYICSSDDYFTENVFEPYVYEAYYAASYFPGETDEYCLQTENDGRISGVSVGGSDAWAMLGHVYFDHAFSKTFVGILEREYNLPETAPKLWEDIYIDHIGDLRMVMRPYADGVVYEFDSLADLVKFDHDFLENVDSAILDNICTALDCSRSEVTEIKPIKEGLTNLSFRFLLRGRAYVYRHPGPGTDEIINRASETFSQEVARRLGVDNTFVFEDMDQGWKISYFEEDCSELDYHNSGQVSQAMDLIRRIHLSGEKSKWTFDLMGKAREIMSLLDGRSYPRFPDYDDLKQAAEHLDACVKGDGIEPCLCHNDFYAPNILVKGEKMSLIDWEYSAMSDYASDLGTFICCSDYTEEEARRVMELYFGRPATSDEERHCFAYVALAAYYWFVWALYKEASGDPVGEWLYLWYRYAKRCSALALNLYDAI